MNRIIVIGGSKGIGNAILHAALASYSEVINISRTAPELKANNLSHITCDITTDQLPDIDQVDALVYCPGSINLKPIKRLSLTDFKTDYDINVIGAVKAIQHFLPALKTSASPAIVLFSSVATKLGMPFHASIAASKAAVEGLTKSLGAELAPDIRINAIAPTVTNTPLASKLLRNQRLVEQMQERHPLKKILQPEEVAELALFLLSKKAQSLSGQVFQMDSGIVSFKL